MDTASKPNELIRGIVAGTERTSRHAPASPRLFAASINAGSGTASNNATGRKRHGAILEVASMGPVWADALIRMGFCNSRRVANRILSKLYDDGKGPLKLLGKLQMGDTGAKTLVYGSYAPGYNQLEHDVMAMQIILAYWPCEFRVGRECDPETRFDGEMELADPFGIEADNDTEGPNKLRKRLEIIARSDRTCLFVSRRVERLRRVMVLAKGMENIFFCPFDEVLRDPWGLIWADPEGGPARVRKGGADPA
jgi:hypothetical protein